MPAIIRDEKQANALREIEDMLAIVANINAVVSSKSNYIITCSEKGLKAAKVDIEDADKNKVEAILLAYKNRLAKSIESKAKNFRISLSEEERASISGEITNSEPKKNEPEKKPEAPEVKPENQNNDMNGGNRADTNNNAAENKAPAFGNRFIPEKKP